MQNKESAMDLYRNKETGVVYDKLSKTIYYEDNMCPVTMYKLYGSTTDIIYCMPTSYFRTTFEAIKESDI